MSKSREHSTNKSQQFSVGNQFQIASTNRPYRNVNLYALYRVSKLLSTSWCFWTV